MEKFVARVPGPKHTGAKTTYLHIYAWSRHPYILGHSCHEFFHLHDKNGGCWTANFSQRGQIQTGTVPKKLLEISFKKVERKLSWIWRTWLRFGFGVYNGHLPRFLPRPMQCVANWDYYSLFIRNLEIHRHLLVVVQMNFPFRLYLAVPMLCKDS